MNAQVRKEVRLLIPAAITAAILALVAASFPDSAMICFALAALLISLTSFGQEMSCGTFSLLLAQPQPRREVWKIKLMLAVAALLPVWLVTNWVSYSNQETLWWSPLLALVAFSGGLWTTLLFRQVIAAFWVTLIPPLAITAFLPSGISRWALLAYSIAGIAFARHLFLEAEDVAWTGGVVSLLKRDAPIVAQKHRRLSAFRALLSKELRLQQVTLFLVPCLFVFHLMALAFRRADPNLATKSGLAEFVWVLWLAVPLVIGSTAVAEERKLGTMQAALCAPVEQRRKFFLKLVLVLTASVVFGVIAPSLIEAVGGMFGVKNQIGHYGYLAVPAVAIGIISFFASTLARNTLHGMGIGFVPSVIVFIVLIEDGIRFGPLPILVLGLALVLALLWPAWSNFKRIDLEGAWLGSIARWLSTVLVLVALAVGVYVRASEFLTPREPSHGPARISPTAPVRLFANFSLVGGIMPDGGIWARGAEWDSESAIWQHLTPATFLPGKDWVDAASAGLISLAIRRDGSLWKITKPRNLQNGSREFKLERVGTNLDWIRIVDSSGGIDALKNNGTLWSWDFDEARFIRRGRRSDWVQLFGANHIGSVGVALDGSAFSLQYVPLRGRAELLPLEEDSQRLPFTGTNWADLSVWAGLDKNGVLWTSTNNWQYFQGGNAFRLFTLKEDSRIEPHPGCRCFASGFGCTGLISDRGHLTAHSEADEVFSYSRLSYLVCFPWAIARLGQSYEHPSKYSDWMALTTMGDHLVALAADGTLCCWKEPRVWEVQSDLFAPSRRP